MKTLFLSDFHLGSPLFNCRTDVINLINSPEFSRIVLVGDIIDNWEQTVLQTINEYNDIIGWINKRSKEIQIDYIVGNHDPNKESIMSIFPNVNIHESLKFKEGIIIHGHEFDDLVTKYDWVARLLFIPHWILERFGINIKAWFRNLFFSVSNKRDKKYYRSLVVGIQNECVEKYSSEYEFAVLGHTHFPEIITNGSFLYVNCGDLIHNKTYIIYDEESDVFKLYFLGI